MAYSPEDTLRSYLEKDKRVRSFKRLVSADGKFALPIADWRAEARLLHSMRQVKNLSASSANFGRKMITATVNESGTRSRLTEMLAQASSVSNLFKDYLAALEDYIFVTYPTELAAVFKTAKDRERFVDHYLRPQHKLHFEVQDFIEEISLYITDIDKSGYSIKAIAEVFTAIFKAEGRVDVG